MKKILLMLILFIIQTSTIRVLGRSQHNKVVSNDEPTLNEAQKIHQILKQKNPDHDTSKQNSQNPYEGIERNPEDIFTKSEMDEIVRQKENELDEHFQQVTKKPQQKQKNDSNFLKIANFYKIFVIFSFLIFM